VAVTAAEGGGGGDPRALFDGDLRRGLTSKEEGPARVRIELDRPHRIAAVGVFGAAGGHLTISAEQDGAWVPVQEMELDPSSAGWRRFTADSPITARNLLLDWQPATPGAVLPEIELWSAGLPETSRIVTARPAAGVKGAKGPIVIDAGTEALFLLRLDRDPATFQRAFLAYELEGLPDWPAAVRSINGLPAQGGFAAQAVAGAGLQLEEINPAWLRRGRNEVRFFPAAREDLPPAAVAGLRERVRSRSGAGAETVPYTVQNVRLILVEDDGHPLVSDVASAAPAPSSYGAALVDGDPGTGWDGREQPAVELPLRKASQPWALDLVTSGRLEGELVVEAVLSGGENETLTRFDLSGLKPGRHRLRLDEDLPAVAALRLVWTGGDENGGSIVEADLLASPGGRPAGPRLQLTRPVSGVAGEGHGHEGAFLRGFAEGNPSALLIDGMPVSAALTAEDGAFEVFVPQPAEPGAWEVDLTLVYPDGTRLTRTVRLKGRDDDNDDPEQESTESQASPGEAKSLALGKARLDVPAGALGQKAALSMRVLQAGELPALETGMTNVTASRGGFRMGPHGLRFRQPVRLTLPYDPALIPPGLTEDDVQTFFFDEETGRWIPITRIAVEAGRRTVVSATDHFTDFINATLTVPDEPAGASFSPNSIRDLGTPDPASGITMIAAPEGGPDGDANLDFPLDLPAGRRGMEPDLTVTYGSGSGNGWLGEGWDLRLPSIEVSTLFGVPRYAPDVETETYVLNGEQLAPTADRTAPAPRTRDRFFTQRTEGEFLRIVRRGSSPDSYFWEVTDKEGTRWIYGQSAAARLQDVHPPHNIFRWHLERVIDLHGNTVEYSYAADGPAPGEGGEPWTQLYPARIDYTGGHGPAFYQVLFVLEDGDRPDRMSSGLSGFKTVTRRRLARVDVLAGGELVNRYRFEFREGEFRKTLLAAVGVSGEDGETELYRHAFDYFGMPRSGGGGDGYAGFSAAAPWSGIGGGRDATATSNFAAGAHVFAGFAPNPACQGHFGVQGGFSAGETSTSALFLDVNGDGLLDRLADDGRVDLNDYDTATGATGFRPGRLDGVDASLAHTGEHSFDVSIGIHAPGEVAGGEVSWVWSHSNDDRGMADVNGDGLPDLLSSGGVRFNDGRSFGPQAPAWSGPALDLTVPGEESELKGALALADALRELELPYDGAVTLTGAVQKKQAGGSDGVVAEIHLGGRRIWRHAFAPDELSPCIPGPGDSCGGGLQLDVQAGQRLHFLAHAIDDTDGDALLWAPRVTYDGRDPDVLEPWGAPVFVFDAGDDFRLAGPPGGAWTAPAGGTVRVLGSILKQPTSDDVTVTIRKNGTVIHSLALAAADAGSFDAAAGVSVVAEDVLTFTIDSDSQIDPERVDWKPIVAFDPTDWPDGVEEPEDQPAQVAYTVHRLLPLDRPTVSWAAPEAGTYTFNLAWQDDLFSVRRAPVKLFAQSLHRLIGKVVVAADDRSGGVSVTAELAAGERVTFTAIAGESGARGNFTVLHGLATVLNGLAALPVNVRIADPEAAGNVLSGGWHGWFYGEWDGSKAFRAGALDPDSRDFVAAVPQWQGSGTLTAPLWRAGGFDLYLAAEGIKPSRRGTNVTAELRRANGGGGGGSGPGLLRKTYGRTEGAGANAGGGSFSLASGYSEVQLDLLDLNGDLLADHVGQGAVGFSTGGGFGAFTAVPGLDTVRRVEDFNASAAAGIGLHFTKKDGKGNPRAVLSTMPSAGATTAVSRTREDLVDVNGDGLPDRVGLAAGSDVLEVRLNLGYRFGAPEAWPLPRWGGVSRCREVVDLSGLTSLDTLDSIALTRSAAYNLGAAFGPIGGGVGVTLSRTLTSLVDVNGDGLADHVAKDGGEDFLRVKLNHGDGWGAEERWYLEDAGWPTTPGGGYNPGGVFQCADGLELTGNIDGNGSAGAPICIPLIPPIPVAGLQIEVSAQASGGDGGLQLSFQDIDGDGLPDQVLKTKGEGTVWVKRNQADKVNLLSTVHGPLGGTIALDYRRQGNRVDHSDPGHRIDMPSSQWVLASSTVDDGRGNSYRTTFDYFNDSFYDRAERESYGYARVRTTRPDGSTVDETFHNQDLYRRHLPVKSVLADASGRLFHVATNRWDLRPVGSRGDAFFPVLAEQSTAFYEGTAVSEGAPPKTTTESFDYDAQGNVIRAADAADEGSDDDTVTTIEYHVDPETHVTAPAHLTVRDGAGRLLRERRGAFDEKGDLVRLEQTLTGGREPASGAPYSGTSNPVWTFSYDDLGNPAASVDPTGYRRTFAYDAQTGTWPTQVADSFGYTSRSSYDLKRGLVTEIIDENGQSIRYVHDGFGRLVQVFAPGDPAGAPTLSFDYDLAARPAWAVVHHKDVLRPGDPIDVSAFIDGLGRTIQTQQDTEIDLGSGTSTRTGTRVSGRIELDALGRIAAEGQPVFAEGPASRFADIPLVRPTTWQYDVLDRVLAARFPHGAETRIDHGFAPFDGTTRFLITRTDPNGRSARIYLDIQGEALAVQQSAKITRYSYNALSEITAVTDPLGHVTRLEYDTLGRNTVLDDPDAGRTEMRWSPGGNLGARITANLAARGQQIRYHHTFHRLERIDYPEMPDVVYTYGGPGAPDNRAGRIAMVTDESGVEERFYGRLGELVRTVKTATALNGTTPKGPYATSFTFDSLNRLLSMTYPDGEALTWAYDAGGRVKSLSGVFGGVRTNYVAHVGYDEFGARVRRVLGNGVETRETFDPLSRDLSRLQTVERGGRALQNLSYTRDKTGLILNLRNDVPVAGPSLAGGPVTQSFVYDELSQLVSAQGSYTAAPNQQSTYSVSLAYDLAGDLTAKRQVHEITHGGGKPNLQAKTSFDWAYTYGGAHPHAPVHLGDRTFRYDANGNQAGWDHDRNGTRRNNTWNEEDRLAAVADNGQTTRFLYNASGSRTNKQGPHGETIYVNRWYSVRNGALGSKHIFADELRIASTVTQPVTADTTGPVATKLYYYHGDPLGSSNFITDAGGEVFQHLEYFPSGEIWVDERTETQRTPYLFSGKELDEETGLSYHGARYYDARQGQWISPDPILDMMLDTGRLTEPDLSYRPFWPAGQMYAYAANNPTNLSDPTGLHPPKGGKGKVKGGAPTPPVIKVKGAARKKSARLNYMGRTPSKASAVGLDVIRRMDAEGLIKTKNKQLYVTVQVGTGKNKKKESFVIDRNIHMGHRIDAVKFWNGVGRYFGPKHAIVRAFMTDSEVYELEHGPTNSSNGASLAVTYAPPNSLLYDDLASASPGDRAGWKASLKAAMKKELGGQASKVKKYIPSDALN
jgi:RHS repeat-associated protein